MKKLTRILSLLALFGLMLSLCGCSYLDELRASRVTITEDGAIRFQDGTEYLALPEWPELSPDFSGDTIIYIVDDEELPLLLTNLYGTNGYKSKDGQFVSAYTGQLGKPVYYCRSDLYDSIRERMRTGFTPEIYCYSYFDTERYEAVLYTLTAQQADALEYILANEKPERLPVDVRLDYEYQIHLYHYSSDYIFRKDAVDICYARGRYYVVRNIDTVYDVPLDLVPTFVAIMEKEMEPQADF